jgi:asparagine synthetase B (glutamine-hydrolysing)
MVHPDTGDWLVFNGEIYNFRVLREELSASGALFRGHSDTEVLLHALVKYGVATFSRLNGMYALAWYRAREQELVLARDPQGIKPLYVAALPEGLVFASETRALLASGLIEPRIDMRGLAGMLAYGAPIDRATLERAIADASVAPIAALPMPPGLAASVARNVKGIESVEGMYTFLRNCIAARLQVVAAVCELIPVTLDVTAAVPVVHEAWPGHYGLVLAQPFAALA